MTRTDSALLEFDTIRDIGKKKKLRDGLSGILQIGNTLWLTNDETISLERITHQGRSANGVHRFGDHVRFALNDYLRLPVPPPHDPKDIEEADVEGLAYRDGYLWLVGSHSLKRKKPKEGKSAQENIKRVEKVSSDGNRYLLARIPLVAENGTYTLKQTAEQGGQRLVAAQLHGDDKGNDLTDALRHDRHLASFLDIPGKDNGLDFEGLAVVDNRLFIGLRGPVLRGWTMILEVEPEEDGGKRSMLILKKIGPGHRPYRKHFLQLGGLGIRDLCLQGSDLLILAGPTMDLDGPVNVFRWPGGARPEEESVVFGKDLTTLLDVPFGQGKDRGTDHAEGMTLFTAEGGSENSLLIVYDSARDKRKKGDDSVEADIFPL